MSREQDHFDGSPRGYAYARSVRTHPDWMPALPAGDWPNLFVIGAQKSGTTSLHNYLSKHPDIFMSTPKEPQYFVDTPWLPKDPEWYLGLFKDGLGASYRGESSPFYTMLPTHQGVPERIARVTVDARFVYIMRDPIRRTISQYWHEVDTLRDPRSFWDLVEEVPGYLAHSDYEMQLRQYVDLFGWDRIYTLTFEHLIDSPVDAVNGIVGWLGLSPIAGESFDEVWNATPEVISQPRLGGVFERIKYASWWGALAPAVPKSLRRLATRLTQRKTGAHELDVDDVVERLRPYFIPKVESLQRFTREKYLEWKTVSPVAPDPAAA